MGEVFVSWPSKLTGSLSAGKFVSAELLAPTAKIWLLTRFPRRPDVFASNSRNFPARENHFHGDTAFSPIQSEIFFTDSLEGSAGVCDCLRLVSRPAFLRCIIHYTVTRSDTVFISFNANRTEHVADNSPLVLKLG